MNQSDEEWLREFEMDFHQELKALIEQRRQGPFLSAEESNRQIEEMLARKRRERLNIKD